MRIPERIRKIPWPEPVKTSAQWKFEAQTAEPVIDHHRWTVVTFTPTERAVAEHGLRAVRVVACRKLREAVIVDGKSHRQTSKPLSGALGWCFGVNGYIKIDSRQEQALVRLIGRQSTMNHYIDALGGWIEQIRYGKRKKSGLFVDEDVNLCPDTLPDWLEDYVREKIISNDHIAIYTKGGWSAFCPKCGKNLRFGVRTRLSQGKKFRCPECGAGLIAEQKTGNANYCDSRHWYASNVGNVMFAQRGADGKTAFLRMFHIQRDPTGRYDPMKKYLVEFARYAFRENQVIAWVHEQRIYHSFSSRFDTFRAKDWQRDRRTVPYEYAWFAYQESRAEFAGTILQYERFSKYEEQMNVIGAVKYFQGYSKYPAFELLDHAGYDNVIRSEIYARSSEIKWKAHSIQKALGVPKPILRKKQPQQWDIGELSRARRAVESTRSWEEAWRLYTHTRHPGEFERILKYTSVSKAIRYLEKQKAEAHTYRDYLRECEDLGLDLGQTDILFPKDLTAAHNRTMQMIEFERNKPLVEQYQKHLKKLKRLDWMSGALSIHAPEDPAELKAEGQALHHCVGGYANSVAQGKTAIFFVRRIDQPDTAFYTLELNPESRRVIQCRTLRNRSYTEDPEVKEFVDRWLETVVNNRQNNRSRVRVTA